MKRLERSGRSRTRPANQRRAQYGSSWPFTVAAGTLDCTVGAGPEAGKFYVTFSHPGEPGVEYGLNGSARDLGFPDLGASILTDYPDLTGVIPLIERGLALCD